jgi:secondary thiamine-phosphate synthase enzyme
MIETKSLEFKTKGENDILNITPDVEKVLKNSDANDGTVVLFVQSTTSGLVIIEYEDGLLQDFQMMMERIAPKGAEYQHEKAWHDGNGHSHMRSSILGMNLVIPFQDKTLLLGQWQQVILAEFDVRPRKRTVIMQILAD